MYVVRLIGGLGNQMFQYAFARSLSLAKGIPFKLDVSWYADAEFGKDAPRTYMLDRFNVAGELATADEVRRARRPGFASRLLTKVWRKVFGANYGFDPRAFAARDGDYLEGFWQSEKYFAGVADRIRQDFTLKDGFGQAAQGLESEMLCDVSVSVHVRRGDFVTNKSVNNAFGTVGLDYLSLIHISEPTRPY